MATPLICLHLASSFCSNIEDTARDAGSVDVDEESLYCKSTAKISVEIHFPLKFKSMLKLTLVKCCRQNYKTWPLMRLLQWYTNPYMMLFRYLSEEKRSPTVFSFPVKVRIMLIVSTNIIPRPKLLVLLQGLIGWISEREDNLQNHEFGHPAL